jgi:hypothetical protein
MVARWAIAVAGALVTALAPRPGFAWQQARQIGDDTTVVVDATGSASVTQQLRFHVARGPLRPIDLANVDPSAVFDTEVSILADDGRTLAGRAVRRDDRTVRISPEEPRAIVRGEVTLTVRSRLDLVATHAITRDGGTWRLVWSSAPALDGFDNARTTVDLPAAPGEPRPIVADTGVVDDAAVATLRRGPERDVLQLLRAHVARGDAPTWVVRIDPHALSVLPGPQASASSVAVVSPEPRRAEDAWLCVALVAIALAFGLLVRHKDRAFSADCLRAGGLARGLLGAPRRVRAVVAGVTLAGAAGLEMLGEPTAGAACLAVAILASALRAPQVRATPRGPGQWVALSPEKAFATPTHGGHWLDIASTAGRRTAVVTCAVVAAAALVAQRFDEQGAWLVALDSAALVPLFVTGRASQLPPHGVVSAAPWLVRPFRRLAAVPGLVVIPWVRVAPDRVTADELRLLVVPHVAVSGVLGLEVGLAWSTTPVGWAATPEVLARFLEGSAAASKLARELPNARSMPGRRAGERVVRLLPRVPTVSSTVTLVRSVAEVLKDGNADHDSRRGRAAKAPGPRDLGFPRV